jgi:NADH:ubiquinone oxidoreductase subunit 6 (subunit J)
MGAFEMAVIELSLSLGLVTVLLAFAVSMVGANSADTMVRRRPDQLLVALVLILLVVLLLPATANPATTGNTGGSFNTVLWETRQPDILGQMALIFAGVLGVLRLLNHVPESTNLKEQAQEPTEADMEAVA